MREWIPETEWEVIVRNVPIPSVDLVARWNDGIILAKRTNEPAKGEWFVPGGRIRKGEPHEDAVHRVAQEELGANINIVERLGTFDHFYDTSDVQGEGKHYVAHGFVVQIETDELTLDDQHDDLRVLESRPEDVHEYVHDYLCASETLPW